MKAKTNAWSNSKCVVQYNLQLRKGPHQQQLTAIGSVLLRLPINASLLAQLVSTYVFLLTYLFKCCSFVLSRKCRSSVRIIGD